MDLVTRNWWKKCRVCNKEGSKNIFDRMSTPSNLTLQIVSTPTDRLLEKLRFVTMIQIDEFDNKPKMLCDMCIIQLNVAYQFKTLAREMDTKHSQFIIENGINSSPSSENSTLQFIEHSTYERSSTTMRPLTLPSNFVNFPHRRVIKSEPTDYENMSDITIDTNTDRVEDYQSNPDNSNTNNQQYDALNMVCVNDIDLLRSNSDSDIEFINNCLPTMAFRQQKPTNTLTTTRQSTTTTTTIASQLVIASSKPVNKIAKITSNIVNSQITRPVEKSSETAVKDIPQKKTIKRKRIKYIPNNEVKKTLRQKSNENIDYSMVRRKKHRQKVINPLNKLKKLIKEESRIPKKSSVLKSSSKGVNGDRRLVPHSKNKSSINDKRKKEFFAQRKKLLHFKTERKINQRQNGKVKRVIIRDTDRFKFATKNTIR